MQGILYSNHGTSTHPSLDYPQSHAWFGSDTQELYKSNVRFFSKLKSPTVSWVQPSIDYTFNNVGMRVSRNDYYDITDDYDFSDKIVILGCSQIQGIGISYEHTLGECLSKLLVKQVINWGVGGCGPDAVFHNAMWLATRERLPLKVIVFWPQPTRFIFDNPETNLTHYMVPPHAWEDIAKYYKKPMLTGDLPEARFKKYRDVLKNVFKERLHESYIHSSMEYRTNDDLPYYDSLKNSIDDNISLDELLRLHYARDIYRFPDFNKRKGITSNKELHGLIGSHQGYIPNKLLAEYVYAKIN